MATDGAVPLSAGLLRPARLDRNGCNLLRIGIITFTMGTGPMRPSKIIHNGESHLRSANELRVCQAIGFQGKEEAAMHIRSV